MAEFSTSAQFAFHAGERVKQGFVRILGELEAAAARLEPEATANPQRVHQASLLVKRLRALLWFARSAFSPIESRWAKRQLQAAAHLLSAQRDAAAVAMKLDIPSQKLEARARRFV